MDVFRKFNYVRRITGTCPFDSYGSTGFIYPGYVDETMGFYNITMDASGIIKHRMFYPMNKVHQIWVGSKDFKFFPR